MTLAEALAAIDLAADKAGSLHELDELTLDAMRFIWRRYPNKELREALLWFHNSFTADNDIGRSQNANASRNRIRWLLRSTIVPSSEKN